MPMFVSTAAKAVQLPPAIMRALTVTQIPTIQANALPKPRPLSRDNATAFTTSPQNTIPSSAADSGTSWTSYSAWMFPADSGSSLANGASKPPSEDLVEFLDDQRRGWVRICCRR